MILVPPAVEKPDVTPSVAKRSLAFEVRKRLKLWVVMRDNIYTGSYPEEASAQAAAQKHIDAIIRGGGEAKMVYAPSE